MANVHLLELMTILFIDIEPKIIETVIAIHMCHIRVRLFHCYGTRSVYAFLADQDTALLSKFLTKSQMFGSKCLSVFDVYVFIVQQHPICSSFHFFDHLLFVFFAVELTV